MKARDLLALQLLTAFALTGMIHAYTGGFGEVASNDTCQCLNFTMYPNTTNSMSWGIINEFNNLSLNYTETMSIRPLGNFTATGTPSISVDPNALVIAPMTILYANVTVNTSGVAPGTTWDAYLLASTQPLGNATTGAIIRLSTLKNVHVHVVAPLAASTPSQASNAITVPAPTPVPQSAPNYYWTAPVIAILVIIVAAWMLSKRKAGSRRRTVK